TEEGNRRGSQVRRMNSTISPFGRDSQCTAHPVFRESKVGLVLSTSNHQACEDIRMGLRIFATALAANLVATTAAIALDANLPAYQAVSEISGQIKSVGSDTLNNEMALWASGFVNLYP